MYPNSIYFGPKVLYRDYFKAKVYAIWVHGPLGFTYYHHGVWLQGHRESRETQGLGLRALGLGFRALGLGFRLQGFGFRVQGSGLWA